MIAGCYCLDLYCENYKDDNYPEPHLFREFPHSYTAETGGECRQQARKEGWILNLKESTAICPKCNPKRKHEKI